MPTRKSRLSKRRVTAIHEAGHAVIGRVLMQVCGGATIMENPEENEAGFAICADPWLTYARWDEIGRWREDMMRSVVRGRIMTFMAGAEAERVFCGNCAGGAGDDQSQIDLMYDFCPEVIVGDLSQYDARLRARTRWLIRHHRRTIEHVAALLLKRGVLQGEEIDAVIWPGGKSATPT